jgi:hypothetical protein
MARPKGIKWDAEELRALYWDQSLSLQQIAGRFGVHIENVRKRMVRFGIERRAAIDCHKSGPEHARWKDDDAIKGYRTGSLRTPSGKRLKPLRHRLVAESVLGRSLTSKEVVHHCNGIRTDNRAENLWVFPSQSAHKIYHARGEIHRDTIFLAGFQPQEKTDDE